MHGPLPLITPREYQVEAVNALYTYFASHTDPQQNPLIACPTGSGKSLIIALFLRTIFERWPNQRVLVLTHVKELIEQNARQLKKFWPEAPVGVYSAGLKSKDTGMPITFAGIQSAIKHPHLFGHIDLIIVDEAHLVSPDADTSYQMFIGFLRQRNPFMRVIGLSATIYRLGLGMLTEGGIFTDVAYDICSRQAFVRLLDDGYMCPLVPMQTQEFLDVSGVGTRGGEFIEKELQEKVTKEHLTRACLREAIQSAKDRNHWLIFATGIEHTEMVANVLTELGVRCDYVHSKVSDAHRDKAISDFKAGRIQALVNAGILTTGFDFPELDCIILLRPTSSPVLHVQILGRGTRPVYAPGFDLSTKEGRLEAIAASDKQSCLVLDFARNTMRLGPINDPRMPKKKGGKEGPIPAKVCNHCGCINHISARVCDNCGEAFEFKEKIAPIASTLDLIVRDEPQTHWFPVHQVTYQPHYKPGSPPSLKVSYRCGLRRFQEYICLFHDGNPIQRKARQWWADRFTRELEGNWPLSVEEALGYTPWLAAPKQIKVWTNLKWPKILDYRLRKRNNE